MARTYSAARFEALYRVWLQDGDLTLWRLQGTFHKEQFQRMSPRGSQDRIASI